MMMTLERPLTQRKPRSWAGSPPRSGEKSEVEGAVPPRALLRCSERQKEVGSHREHVSYFHSMLWDFFCHWISRNSFTSAKYNL